MSLQTAFRRNIFSSDVASVSTIDVDNLDAGDVLSSTLETTNLIADQITEAQLTATTLTTDTLNSATVSCTSLDALNANFTNPPTCGQVPSAANQLVNKLYVDNAVPSGGTVEEVSGIDPISPTVNTTLLTGTTHTLPSGTSLGTIKTIVNMNESAFSRALGVNFPTILPLRTAVFSMTYDAVTQRLYVAGQFPPINGIENTENLAYYDFQASEWKSLGAVFTTNTLVNDILLKGSRLYIIGNFTSVFSKTASDNTRYVAYYDFNDNIWKPLVPESVGTAFATPSTTNGNGILFLRAFPTMQNIVFLCNMTSFTYPGILPPDNSVRVRVLMYDESNTTSNPFYRLFPNTYAVYGISSSYIYDILVVDGYLYAFGQFNFRDEPDFGASDNVISTYSFQTGNFVSTNLGLTGTAFSVLPYNWNGTDGYLVLGSFTAPVKNIIFIPATSLVNPTVNPIVLQQFPPAFDTLINSYVFPTSTASARIVKDAENTLYITNLSLSFLSNSSNPQNSGNTVFTAGINSTPGIFTYDPLLTPPRWRVLTNPYRVYCMTNTPSSNKVWFGGDLVSGSSGSIGVVQIAAVAGVLFTANMVIELDKTKVQQVVGTFVNNTREQQVFQFVYKGQTLTFLNVDNTRWVLIKASSNLVSAGGGQQQSGVVYFT